nr:hypothetical protein [Oceanococcus sp. HetDA_MAG_MS8]
MVKFVGGKKVEPMKLPDDVRRRLQALEWDNRQNLSGRMLGTRVWPIRVALNSPSGVKAIDRLTEFREFALAWKAPDVAQWVATETRNLRGLGAQEVPTHLILETLEDLVGFLGAPAAYEWAAIREGLERVDTRWCDTWRHFVSDLVELDQGTVQDISRAVVQLKSMRGCVEYVRELPLDGVGTKVVEQHERLIGQLVDLHYCGEVAEAGGLLAWLGVRHPPKDWLMVRPLCEAVRQRFHGADSMRMGWQTLAKLNWPASTLFVVENATSVFALPEVPDGVAVAGTGGNIGWLESAAKRFRRVIYWGDLDYDGLAFLSRARRLAPGVTSMLTSLGVYAEHGGRAIACDSKREAVIDETFLTKDERRLLCALVEGGVWMRLEQEKLPGNLVASAASLLAKG